MVQPWNQSGNTKKDFPGIPGVGMDPILCTADDEDFSNYPMADFIVHGRKEMNTPSLVVEMQPLPEQVPITVVAMNNKGTLTSGLLMLLKQPEKEMSSEVATAAMERNTEEETIDIVMRKGVLGTLEFNDEGGNYWPGNRLWEALRWGHPGMHHLVNSIMSEDDPKNYTSYNGMADFQHRFFLKMYYDDVFAYLSKKGVVHTYKDKNGETLLTKLSWSSTTSNDAGDSSLLSALKEAVARVGVGLWDILQEETSLQHPTTYKSWANKPASRDLRECLGIPDRGSQGMDPQNGAVNFGFESAEVALYYMNRRGDFLWNDAVSDTNHDDFETSVLLISHLSNV